MMLGFKSLWPYPPVDLLIPSLAQLATIPSLATPNSQAPPSTFRMEARLKDLKEPEATEWEKVVPNGKSEYILDVFADSTYSAMV